jgi:diguanylate cyclase (GGDEF)-like protein
MIRFRRISTRLSTLYGSLFAIALAFIAVASNIVLAQHVRQNAAQELETSANVFTRLWDFRTKSLVDNADILARDFGFREAVATGDEPTIASALTNVRGRIGDGAAFTVFSDGRIVGDGAPALRDAAANFPFHLGSGRRAAVVHSAAGVFQMVMAPVRAPVDVGWVVFALPVGAKDMRALEGLSAVPLTAAILYRGDQGWRGGETTGAVLQSLRAGRAAEVDFPGGSAYALISTLPGPDSKSEAALLISYRLADAMAPFRAFRTAILLAGILGLALVIAGSIRLARSIARPIARLETAARAVEQGDYGSVQVTGNDEIAHLAASFNAMARGIAEREDRIGHMALHDALTGLPNRALFREQTDVAIRQAATRGETVAVLCIDIDNFRQVNDTLGHTVGDAMLRQLAGIFSAWTGDALLARLSTSEFGVLVVSEERDRPRALARTLIDRLGEPLTVAQRPLLTSASVGIAVAPTDGSNADTLLKNADLALHRAAEEGRGSFRFFEPALDAEARARHDLEIDLRGALGAGQLRLDFQPLLSLKDDRICGFEALLRWDHPERGPVSPAEFIPIAEETGLIVPIGEFVIQEACRKGAQWPDPVRIAVNVSALQFRSPALQGIIVQALARSGLAPHRLEIEMTESIFVENSDATLKLLHSLRSLGIRIALDDFGTGYSSLSYLRRFPFDKIKIDRSFVIDIGSDPQAASVVGGIVDLATSLGMDTTAEGVEDERQMAVLRELGCGSIQGYLFSKPLDATAALELLGGQRQVRAA